MIFPYPKNFIRRSDSYKQTHARMYLDGTETVYTYFEARKGGEFPETVFYGLQEIIASIAGQVVTQEDVDNAAALAEIHFQNKKVFNREGWEHIVQEHGGRLPVRIKAVPEGTPVPLGNVVMTIENTDPKCFWLTNFLESLLLHVWYPSTVATLSRAIKGDIQEAFREAGVSDAMIDFMLQDFGYRGATGDEAAARGGSAHLVNFKGTDTLVALEYAMAIYDADPTTLGFSVPASEHSIMTAAGRELEFEVVQHLLDEFPDGILSLVIDSYNCYNFVDQIGTRFKDQVLARDGILVLRPDSTTEYDLNPEDLMVALFFKLWDYFGGTYNEKGYRVLDPKVRILWGDGIDRLGIRNILRAYLDHMISPENIACFGMGGGLLQKVNRDTQRWAAKSSAQLRNGTWYDVYKDPLDHTKASKKGRLKLIHERMGFVTVQESNQAPDQLVLVFENGEVKKTWTFDEIRERAKV